MTKKSSKINLKSMRTKNRLGLARILTQIENRDLRTKKLIDLIYKDTGRAQVIGITGPPGAGKSTLVDQLVKKLRKENKTVAVLAVDPSSPFSGGAVLGDRIRMQDHFSDNGVYIRSIGTRGRRGGISHSTQESIMLLDAAGFDLVIVETAGVGQTELDILEVVQTVVVVLVPESGDGIQAMKAGIMEIADVFAVNKSDRPQADQVVKELLNQVALGEHDENTWIVPVQKTQALCSDGSSQGIDELLTAIFKHQSHLSHSQERQKKERGFILNEIQEILAEKQHSKLKSFLNTPKGNEIIQALIKRKTSPYISSQKINRYIS